MGKGAAITCVGEGEVGINKIGLYRGPHAQLTLGNPEHVERALNQSPKI